MKSTFKYSFPLPPTTNQTYRAVYSSRLKRTVFFMNYDAKKWLTSSQKTVATLYQGQLIEDRVSMTLNWYLKHARDIDGGLKLILDVFEGTLLKNDKQVKELHIYVGEDKENPHIEVSISLLDENRSQSSQQGKESLNQVL